MTMMTTYPSNRDYHMLPMPHPPACPWNRTTGTIHARHRQPVLSFIIITTNNTHRLRQHPLRPGSAAVTVIDARPDDALAAPSSSLLAASVAAAAAVAAPSSSYLSDCGSSVASTGSHSSLAFDRLLLRFNSNLVNYSALLLTHDYLKTRFVLRLEL